MDQIFLVACTIILFSSLTKGLIGFGNGLVSVPFLLFIYPPQMVVSIAAIHTLVIDLFNIKHFYKHINFKYIWPLLVTAAIGVLLGAYTLSSLNTNLLKAIIGFIIMIISLALLSGSNYHFKSEKKSLVPVGLLSGFLNGAANMGGPPIVLFYANQNTSKLVFRANMACYLICLNIITILTLFKSGLMSNTAIYTASLLLPITLIGMAVGLYFSSRISECKFKKLILTVIFVTGLVAVVSSL